MCVRKRPLFPDELKAGDIDSVTCLNPRVAVHETKFKVDGITKYMNNSYYDFDNSFSENTSSETVYQCTLDPAIRFVCETRGTVTCLAYG